MSRTSLPPPAKRHAGPSAAAVAGAPDLRRMQIAAAEAALTKAEDAVPGDEAKVVETREAFAQAKAKLAQNKAAVRAAREAMSYFNIF